MRKPFDELQHRGKKLNKHALTHLQNFFGDFAGFFQLHKIKKHSFRSNISHHIKKAHHHIRTHHKKYIGGILGGFAVIKMVLLFMGFFGILLHMNTSAVYVAVDTTFATKEPVGFNAQVSAMAVQSDGKIIMGGSFTTYRGVSKNYIIRLASNGTIDTGFNIGIGLNSSVMAIAIETGGKIILGGNFTSYSGTSVNRIIRLYSSGIIDTGFSIGAGCNGVVNAIAIDTGGNIILGGAFGTYSGAVTTGIVRLTNNGLRDTSFVIGGFSGIVNALQIETGGKIIVGGTFNLYSGAATTGIVRLTNTGLKDPSFVVGLSITGAVNALDIQDDGKIIAGGSFWTYSGVAAAKIIRLTNTGFKDPSFVIGGGFNSDVNSITLQNNGKIIVGGSFNSYSGTTSSDIARLNTSGTIDTSFAIGGGFNSTVMALATGNNNTILVGGSFTTYNGTGINYVINLDTSGNINTGFVIGFGFSSNIAALVRQSDGKIVVGGSFVTYSGGINKYIVRLASNGTIDTSLIGGGFNSAVTALALETGGKIIAGGSFTNYSGTTINRIARITSAGVLDTTFVIGAGFNTTVNAVAVQADGKIVVGGSFTTYSGATVNYITRLTNTGVRDTTFIGTGFDALVYAVAIQTDQKIVIGGNFRAYSGILSQNYIIRLNANGTIDTGFNIGGGFNNAVSSLAIQDDGKIIVGGAFTTYSGAGVTRLARLNTNGSIDTGFFTGAGANSTVSALAIQTDKKILAGGSFTTYSGVAATYILRLNASGTMDLGFTIGAGLNNAVAAILTGNNNSVFVGGNFTLFNGGINGATAGYLALLYTDSTPPSTPTLVSPGSGTTSYA
ncbi:MAG: hypothetical protein NTX91_00250, partial [candidate division SR1 bacterium]|nr:hypothetical protein [candidate division SR1 bacterium]